MTATTRPNDIGWDRRRLIGVLAAVVVVSLSLLVGLGYGAHHVITTINSDDERLVGDPGARPRHAWPSTPLGGAGRRDAIAAAPMLPVPAEAMHPAPPTEQTAPRIDIPDWTVLGPLSVLTGFPRTPQGAVGQLAQIEATVLQSMSLPTATQVYRAWALPGGTGSQTWRLTLSVQAFLHRTGMGQGLDATAAVTVDPVAAQIKGTDGPDWVTACVLLQVAAVYRTEGHVAFGHCERMQWAGGRWMIAPGRPPAPAPSTWPHTAASINAGWRTWVTATAPSEDPDGAPPVPGAGEQEGG